MGRSEEDIPFCQDGVAALEAAVFLEHRGRARRRMGRMGEGRKREEGVIYGCRGSVVKWCECRR